MFKFKDKESYFIILYHDPRICLDNFYVMKLMTIVIKPHCYKMNNFYSKRVLSALNFVIFSNLGIWDL